MGKLRKKQEWEKREIEGKGKREKKVNSPPQAKVVVMA